MEVAERLQKKNGPFPAMFGGQGGEEKRSHWNHTRWRRPVVM